MRVVKRLDRHSEALSQNDRIAGAELNDMCHSERSEESRKSISTFDFRLRLTVMCYAKPTSYIS
jgi:hypothetical protein